MQNDEQNIRNPIRHKSQLWTALQAHRAGSCYHGIATSIIRKYCRIEAIINKYTPAYIDADIEKSEQVNANAEKATEQLTREIDQMVLGVEKLKGEEASIIGKIERLKKKAMRQQAKVEEMAEWTDFAVDRSNRSLVFKAMSEKKEYLESLN